MLVELTLPPAISSGLEMRAISLGCVAMCMAFAAQGAHADVLEISDDGAIATRASDTGSATTFADPTATDQIGSAESVPDVPSAAMTIIDSPVVPVAYRNSLAQAAATAQVSPSLLAALVWQESRWRPTALSAKGARGLTQLMPATARSLAVDPGDTTANLAGGARYLRSMLDLFNGNVERALAAYNAGPGRVLRGEGLPAIAETRAYVTSIIDRLGTTGAVLQGAKP